MALLSDLGKHKKDDPAQPAVLTDDLKRQLRADLQPQRDGRPTTVIHQRVQALIDTSRAGSEAIGSKLDNIKGSLGDATALSGRIDKLQDRFDAFLGGRLPTTPTAPPAHDGQSNHPPKVLSDEQFVCLRALAQIDAQLADKDTTVDQLNRNLDTKFKEKLGQQALELFLKIREGDTWRQLCSPVSSLSEVPTRVSTSYILRGVVLRSFLLEENVSDVL